MILNALGWSQANCQPRVFHPHYISTFQIYLMDYPGQNFIKLKYSNIIISIIQRGQSHLDLHIDFASTWLYPIAFHRYIRNPDNSAPKHSELLASHYDDLRSEGYLHPYTSWAALDSRMLSRWVTYSVMMYSYISPVYHTSVTILLG